MTGVGTLGCRATGYYREVPPLSPGCLSLQVTQPAGCGAPARRLPAKGGRWFGLDSSDCHELRRFSFFCLRTDWLIP